MNRRDCVFIGIMFISFLSSASYAKQENSIVIYDDLKAAQELSKKENKLVLLIFSADYCGYCTQLKTEIIETGLTEKYITCIIDAQKDRKLARHMRAKALPTSIILDYDGNEIRRITGFNKEPYIEWLSK
jgi:thioredoxin-related protein